MKCQSCLNNTMKSEASTYRNLIRVDTELDVQGLNNSETRSFAVFTELASHGR